MLLNLQVDTLVLLDELDFVGLKQINQSIRKLLMVLGNQLVTGLGRLGHIDGLSYDQVQRFPPRNHAVAVLKEAAADEFGGRNARHCLDKVLPTTELCAWFIVGLVEQVQLAEGEDWHEGSSVLQSELDESLSLLQDDLV